MQASDPDDLPAREAHPGREGVTRRLISLVLYRRIQTWLARDAKAMQSEDRAWNLARLFLLLTVIGAAAYAVYKSIFG